MRMFTESPEALSNELLLWDKPSSNVSVEDCYELKIYPRESISKYGPTTFVIPPQPQGMLTNVDVVTTFKLQNSSGGDVSVADQTTVINNIANAIWGMVEVNISDRTDIMQSMRNSYAYITYFNTILNTDPNRIDYLKKTQNFVLDTGLTKEESDDTTLAGIDEEDTLIPDIKEEEGEDGGDEEERTEAEIEADKKSVKRQIRIAVNKAGIERRRALFNPFTSTAKLHCPLLNSHKALPSNLNMRITLTKNQDSFILMEHKDYGNSLVITDVFLKTKFLKPSPVFLSLIEERLAKEAASFYIPKPELIVKPIGDNGQYIKLNNLFTDNKLPHHAFFCLQYTDHFQGDLKGNPFSFLPFTRFQLHVDGRPYFADPLSTKPFTSDSRQIYDNESRFLQQLYSSIGISEKGSCLINSSNFQSNFMVGISLKPDRIGKTQHGYLSPEKIGSTNLEIELESVPEKDVILIIYAIYDRLVKINGDRVVEIIE